MVLRASGSESVFARDVQRLGLDGVVTLAPPVSNREALVEQARADGLLLFQGARFNRQIPAKLYEYLRIGRPIFALVDARGDTATVLRDATATEPIPTDDADAIAQALPVFLRKLRDARGQVSPVTQYSRAAGARSLGELLDSIAKVPRAHAAGGHHDVVLD